MAEQDWNSHDEKLRITKQGYTGSQSRAREEKVKRDVLFAWEGPGMVKGTKL